MLIKKIMLLGMISILLTTTVLGANSNKCLGGVCFINLDKLQPSTSFKKGREELLVLEKPRYIENDLIDRSMTIVLDGETITVFPKSSYVMGEIEITYYDEPEVNQDSLLVIKPLAQYAEIVLDEKLLPNSEFFCEKNTKILYNKENNTFQCV